MRTVTAVLVAGLLLWPGGPLHGQLQDPEIGATAPGFTLLDTHGTEHSLAEFSGQWVVLEWLNYGCPFVGKHYDGGNMQRLQAEFGGKGVVWLSIVSSAPGEQGYYEPDGMNAMNEEKGNMAAAVLLDPEGIVGRAYGAKTTPQMYLIDPDGVLLYNGAIDDRPTTRVSDLDGATNHLVRAAEEAMAGQPVTVPTTQPYGCSVKYR